jgi:TPR repeat protein
MKRIFVIGGITAGCVLLAGIALYLRPQAESPVSAAPPAPPPIDVEAVKTKAEKGDAVSQAQLGKAFVDGAGVRTDFKQAAYWLGLAASNGNVQAEAMFGELCQAGQGVPRDFAAATQWFTKAAERGSVSAQFDLGYMYDRGQGHGRDPKASAHWYQLAAEGGDALSQYAFGQQCVSGKGATKDPVEGLKWLLLSAAQGQTDAQTIAESVKSGLSGDQIADAKKRAAAFKPRSAGP